MKGEDIRDYMKSIGDRLGKQEKAKQGNLWDLIKSKMIDTYFFYISGYRIFNSQQFNITMRGFVVPALVQWL